jgi:hypothetical protein
VLPSDDTSPRALPDDLVPRIDHKDCAVFVDRLLAGWAIFLSGPLDTLLPAGPLAYDLHTVNVPVASRL